MFKYKRILLLVGAVFLTTSCYSDFFRERPYPHPPIQEDKSNIDYFIGSLNKTNSKVYFYQNYGINNIDYMPLIKKEVFNNADLSLDPYSRFDFILFDLNSANMELTREGLNNIYQLLENNRLAFVLFVNGGNYNFLKDTKFNNHSFQSHNHAVSFSSFESKFVTSASYLWDYYLGAFNSYYILEIFVNSINRLYNYY